MSEPDSAAPGIEEETSVPVVANGAATDNKEKVETGGGGSVMDAEKGKNDDGDGVEQQGDDAKMVESEDVKMVNNGEESKVDNEDVQMVDTEDGGKKEAEDDVKMGEAEGAEGKVAGSGSTEDDEASKEKDKEAVKQDEDEEERVRKEKPDESKEEEKVVNKQKENRDDGKAAAEKQEEEIGEGKNVPEKRKELEGGARADAKKKVAEEEEEEEKGAAEKQVDQTEGAEKKDGREVGTVQETKEETPKNKKSRSVRDKGQRKDKKQDGSNSKEEKELWSSPSPYALDRPVRERKTVERLVEVIEKEPNRNFIVEKGRGTPLKDIPNVAHKLARKKPDDLKLLHQILFGRRGKAIDFKSHILQFSGFVWHESDEKQRAKTKEKLDKFVKDTLLDVCDLFDIPVAKADSRKEDLVVKLLDFIAEPHAMAESVLSEEQVSKYRKRKRAPTGSSTASKRSRKEYDDEDTPTTKGKRAQDDDPYFDEDEDNDEANKESESQDHEDQEADEEDEYEHGSGKAKSKKSSKRSSGRKSSITGTSPVSTVAKSPNKTPSFRHTEKGSHKGAKVFSRKSKSISTPKRTPSSEKATKEKKSSGKKMAKAKGKTAETEKSGPLKEDLRKTITMILKKVDFNTATFSDILKKLEEHYKMHMTPRKATIKVLIQEELTKLAREDEDEGDGEKKDNLEQDKEIEV